MRRDISLYGKIGCGIGGLAMAAALRTVGFQAEVFEQAPTPREIGAGVGLWSNALSSLDQLGVGDSVRARSVPIRVLAGANARGEAISLLDLDDLGAEFADAACFIVARQELLAALATRVPSELVHGDSRALGFTQTDKVVTLDLAGGRREVADLLIAADGMHSVVRPTLVPDDRLRYSGQTCFRGIARVALPPPYVLREVQGAGIRGAVCPIDAQRVYWWAAYNSAPNAFVAREKRREHLLERYRAYPFDIPEAIDATPTNAILQHDLCDRQPISRYTRGRVALIGDAAHPSTPNLGQGANMAIDDAIALTRALREEPSISAAFARYERERVPRTRKIVERSWSFGRLCRWSSRPSVWLRESMLRLTPQSTLRDLLRWQILETAGPL